MDCTAVSWYRANLGIVSICLYRAAVEYDTAVLRRGRPLFERGAPAARKHPTPQPRPQPRHRTPHDGPAREPRREVAPAPRGELRTFSNAPPPFPFQALPFPSLAEPSIARACDERDVFRARTTPSTIDSSLVAFASLVESLRRRSPIHARAVVRNEKQRL